MRNVRDKLLATILLLTATSLHSQEVSVRGGFVQESMKLGQPVEYWLSATYPAHMEMLLPDSLYSFAPFEFSAKRYYASVQNGAQVTDSVIYTLQSYEIDPVQYLELPGWVLMKGDTTAILAPKDSILFFAVSPAIVSDTTQLRTNTDYQAVSRRFNYPLWGIVLGVLAVLGVAGLLLFGKKIQRYWKLRKLRKEYALFSDRLTAYIRELRMAPEEGVAEKAITDWKAFLEKLESQPYSKLTTREIMSLEHTAELRDSLRNIDKCVYGKMKNEALYKDFEAVEDFTQHRYAVITDQIKNGQLN